MSADHVLLDRPDLLAEEAHVVHERRQSWRARLRDLGDYGTSGGSAADRRAIVEHLATLERVRLGREIDRGLGAASFDGCRWLIEARALSWFTQWAGGATPCCEVGDRVEVMPVSEHERLRERAQAVIDAWRAGDPETPESERMLALEAVLEQRAAAGG